MSVKLVVETKEGPSASELAVELAEAYNEKSVHQSDAAEFEKQADRETSKIREYQELLGRVRERDRRLAAGDPPPETKSRMDPMLTYDAGALETEIETIKKKASRFRFEAVQAAEKASKADTKAKHLQVKIRAANERERKQAAKRAAQISG